MKYMSGKGSDWDYNTLNTQITLTLFEKIMELRASVEHDLNRHVLIIYLQSWHVCTFVKILIQASNMENIFSTKLKKGLLYIRGSLR